MSPTILLLAILAVATGLIYHLWRGGGFERLLLSIIAAGIGIAIGQVLSQLFGWRLILLGEVHLVQALIGGLLVLVLINRPDVAPSGAGEPTIRVVAAAIANAIFDATGVRIRRVPFSPDRVKQALS